MKKSISVLLGIIMGIALTACGAKQESGHSEPERSSGSQGSVSQTEEGAKDTDSSVLIAYFSVPEDVDTSGVDAIAGASIVVREDKVMGNTEYVAKVVQQAIGGELFRIETAQQYPLDHDPLVDQAADEQDGDARPEHAAHIEDNGQYDYIVLGFPNWLAYHNLIQCTQAGLGCIYNDRIWEIGLGTHILKRSSLQGIIESW